MIQNDKIPENSDAEQSLPTEAKNALHYFNVTKSIGDKIGQMKKSKAPKEDILKAVDELKTAKAEYKSALGHDYDANNPPAENAPLNATSSNSTDPNATTNTSTKTEQVVTPWDVKGD